MHMTAMELVREFGNPSLFITFICKKNWKEIVRNLIHASLSNFLPELIAKIFEAKMEELMNDLNKKQVLWKVLSYLYVNELN